MDVNFSTAFFGLWEISQGGLARFIPCHPSAHYARLSHLGWGRYGHGLSSRPRESCDHQFLTPLLNFFGYPDGAVTELFSGTLKLRYSSTLLSKKFPSWSVSTHPGCFPVAGPAPGPSPVFISQIMILCWSVQRNACVSQAKVPLSGENRFLGMVFQRLNDGKG